MKMNSCPMKMKKLLLMLVLILLASGMTGVAYFGMKAEASDQLTENSWRYKDGEPIDSDSLENFSVFQKSYYASASYTAWGKLNGYFVNSEGNVITGAQKKGIDVSKWQGKIDWEKVKAAGIDFAIIRCGYGSNKTAYDDAYWEYNASECERLGIPYGVYLYSYATTTAEAKDEASHVLRLLSGHTPTYAVYLDMEDDSTTGVSSAMLGQIAKTFCDTVSAAGYEVGIYANTYWWENYLTSSVFDNLTWYKWVAQWNATCSFDEPYYIWQCTSSGTVNGVDGDVDLNFLIDNRDDVEAIETDDSGIITCRSYLETYGWQSWTANGDQNGLTGYSKQMEAIQIKIGSGYSNLGVKYSACVQEDGWQSYVYNGATAGTTGQSKYMQAIKIELTGTAASDYDIYYRVHSQTYGWLDWAKNGEAAGTFGYGKRIEAIQIVVLPAGSAAPGSTSTPYMQKAEVLYKVHSQSYGWLDTVSNGTTAGTTGLEKRLEALTVKINGEDGGIQYRTHVQSYGWMSWVSDGAAAGTTGQAKRMEAVQINLIGTAAEKYDVYYRVYVQTYGWLDWAKNGETAGTIGLAKRMEAIQIVLVEKGGSAPGSTDCPNLGESNKISYVTHVQSYGWGATTYDGYTSGTTGLAKRLEAIKIQWVDDGISGGVRYRTHVQSFGWLGWVSNNAISGTTGLAKRLEAIQIELTGEAAEKYDIYYRVHSQTYGWLGWAKNGETAGTTGLSKRLEAIEIKVVPKGTSVNTGGTSCIIGS